VALPDHFLGYWCSGHGHDYATIVAWVEVDTMDDAMATVAKFWPDHGDWRFCSIKQAAPGDRFPRPEWATGTARDAAWSTT